MGEATSRPRGGGPAHQLVWHGHCKFLDHTSGCAAFAAGRRKEDSKMLRWAVIFLVIALVAAALGFGGIAGDAAGIAKILFVVFLVVAAISLVLGRRTI